MQFNHKNGGVITEDFLLETTLSNKRFLVIAGYFEKHDYQSHNSIEFEKSRQKSKRMNLEDILNVMADKNYIFKMMIEHNDQSGSGQILFELENKKERKSK